MGKYIDQIVFGGLAAAGLYLFFLNAWGSIPLAAGLALLCASLGRKLVKERPHKRKASAAQTRGALLRLAGLNDGEAQAEMTKLVKTRWPEEDFTLAPVLKHPEATLSTGDILNAWKANRQAGRLVVCATCPAESRALAYARELADPVVAVVDSRSLASARPRSLAGDAPAPPRGPRERPPGHAPPRADGRLAALHLPARRKPALPVRRAGDPRSLRRGDPPATDGPAAV